MERFRMTVAAYLVVIRDGKALLLRRSNTGYADGMYSMIAGHLDGGETVAQCIAREASEEACLTVDENDVEIAHVMHRRGDDGNERIDYFCTAKKYGGEPVIGEPEKCDDLSWFPVDALPANTLPYINTALECLRNDVKFSSVGF